MNRPLNLIRALFVTFLAFVGFQVGGLMIGSGWEGLAAGLAFGLAVVLADRLLKGVSLRLFSSATFGLFMGFVFARLLLASDMLLLTNPETRWLASLLIYATCAYLATMLAMRSNREDFSLIIPYIRFRETSVQDAPLILDANVIIDGRVAELCATGFLSSALVVPRFIVEELQRLGDSGEPLKRGRGRRALERLQRMQAEPSLQVSIHEGDLGDHLATDMKLVQLARLLDARLVTNDANLCSVARLQGVSPLNLHELARALRPVLAIGDDLSLELSKEGREPHQAVGYLPDGTMVIVNQARAYLGQTVSVRIGSTLPTAAGRLYFAELA